jgi:predicted 3-demethylubiquinone-9 3-methyltransferase (glyoxalase superfamily)
MQKITPFLWFNDQAEEAVKFYVSIFKNSRILETVRYNDSGAAVSGRPRGSVMTISFELEGQKFVALNGGPIYKFTPAISFVVDCKTQKEVDRYWDKLSKGGGKGRCAWLTDKFGVSWQIVPRVLIELLQHNDPEKSKRVMQTMLKMRKIDIAGLKRAVADK